MIQIVVFDKDDYSELYQEVLIDTPVGPYFMRFLESCMHGLSENFTLNDVQNLFKEMRPENIRTSLKKVFRYFAEKSMKLIIYFGMFNSKDVA